MRRKAGPTGAIRSLLRRYRIENLRYQRRKSKPIEFHVEACEQRLLLAASDWNAPSPQVIVSDLTSGLEDQVLVTIGDPESSAVVPDGRYEATLENLEEGVLYTITVNYDLSTTGSWETMKIFAGSNTLLAPTDDYSSRPLLVNVTGTSTFRVAGGSSFSVGLQNYGESPADASYGTMEISTEFWQPEQSHDTYCDDAYVSGGTTAAVLGEHHRGDGTSLINVSGGHQLLYKSGDNPHPILTANYFVPTNARASTNPDSHLTQVRATLRINGTQYGDAVYLDPAEIASNHSFTSAFQVDASELGSAFDYQITLEGLNGRGFRIGGDFDQTISSTYAIHDRADSYFGNRVWLMELHELDIRSDGVTFLSGDSDAVWFEKVSPNPLDGEYKSPHGVFSTLRESNGTFTLTDHMGFKTNFDFTGKMLERVDPNGNVTEYLYVDANSDGEAREISRIIDPFGRETTIGYIAGMAASITDFAGRETTLSYSGGRLASVLSPDPDGGGPLARPEAAMLYNGDGTLAGIRDSRNATNALTYDTTFGLVNGGQNANGTSWSLNSMLSAGVVDPTAANGVVPALPDSERFSTHVDTLGNRTETTTDAFGLLTSLTDALGNDYVVQRDLQGRKTAVIEPDPDGEGPLGSLVTRFSYADCANVSEVVFADGSTNQWTYNDISNPTTYVDEIGRITQYAYDASGYNLTRHTQIMGELDSENGPSDDAEDIVHTYTYTTSGTLPRGLLLTATDPLGRVTSYTYETDTSAHDFGWLKQVTFADETADEASIHYEYDSAGNVTAYVDELGRRTDYVYDGLDRLISITEPNPNNTGSPSDRPVTTYDYDSNNNLTKVTDAEGNATEYAYDEYNRLIETKDAAPDESAEPLVTTYVYDGNNNLIRTVDPAGRVTTFAYDMLDRRTATIDDAVDGTPLVTNPLIRFDVDANGIVDVGDTNSLDSSGYDASLLTFDPRSERPDYFDVNADGAITVDDYDLVQGFIDTHDANLDGVVDELEIQVAGISYSPNDLDGQPVTLTEYDNVGNVSATIDANGNRTEYRYDARHRLIETILPSVVDEMGDEIDRPVVTSVYDLAGQMISQTDALGRTTVYEFDDAGRLIRATEPEIGGESPTTQYAYDLASNLVRVRDPLHNETSLQYDARDRLIRRTEPDPSPDNGIADVPVTTYEYDDASRLTLERAPQNRVTEYEYDALDRVTEIRLPTPGVDTTQRPIYQFAYDKVGNLLGALDPERNLTRYRYDNVYRQTQVIEDRPDGVSVGRQLGLVAATSTESIASLRTSHPVTEYVYDAVGNITQVTDPLLRETRFAYDALHRKTITAFADPASGIAPDPATLQPGSSTTPMMAYRYDLFGNILSEQDAINPPMIYGYDAWHRIATEVDARGDETEYHYDLANNLRFLIDAEQNTTEWQYDALDRTVREINSQAFTRDFVYDLASNLTQKTDRNGRVTSYAYDDLYRITSERWYVDASHFETALSSPLRDITFAYDTASRLTRVSDPDATYEYTYDGLDRVQIASQQLAGLIPQVRFGSQFDRNNQTTRLNATIGGQVDSVNTMDYDNLLRLTNITQQSSSAATGHVVAFKQADLTYDLADQRTALVRRATASEAPIVATTNYQFDQVGRIQDISHQDETSIHLAGYHFAYRADHRISMITSLADATNGATGSVRYNYDERGQLVGEQYDFAHYQQSRTYVYDQNGNRQIVHHYNGTIEPGNLAATNTYETPINNRVTDDGTFMYTYDGEGNRTTRTHKVTGERTEYEWDHRNRLVSVTTGSVATRNASTGATNSPTGITTMAGGEVGEVTVDQLTADTWITVLLQRQYQDPVVVTGPASGNDGEQTTVRVRNVTTTSFEIQLDEWDSQDGVHGTETVAYLVMEAGAYVLSDGTQIEAGTLASDQRPRQWEFEQSFEAAPIVLASVISADDPAAVAVHVDRVQATGFRVRMREEQASRKDAALRKHPWERIGYIAISGSGGIGTNTFSVGKHATGRITSAQDPVDVSFSGVASANPLLFATSQTMNGSENYSLRYDNLTASGVTLYLQEDTSYDTETGHNAETLGYAVFDEAGVFDLPTNTAGGEAGVVTFDQISADAWVTVSLQRQYLNPVIVTGPASFNDSEQTTVRVRNVTTTSFEIQLDEWDYQDGVHATESVGYFVVEAGLHVLADGSVLEAGKVLVDHRRTQHEFGLAFNSPPILMASTMSSNDPAAVITRLGRIGPKSFEVQLREEESARQPGGSRGHEYETIGYVAVSAPTTSVTLGELAAEVGIVTSSLVPDADTPIPLSFTRSDHSAATVFLAAMQTHNGGNPAALRFDGLAETGTSLFIREEESVDTETRHVVEAIGYLAFPAAGTFELTTVTPTESSRVENSYDAFNQWVGQITDTDGDPTTSDDRTRTAFVHHNGQIVYEFAGLTGVTTPLTANDLRTRNLWSDRTDELLAQESVTALATPGEVVWPLTDHLNTVRDIIDSSGAQINHRTYTAFGELIHETEPAAASLAIGFTGRYYAEDMGLQNNLHRWYDASIGRWASEDPIGFAAGDANLYRYVGNAPENSTDPLGLDTFIQHRQLNPKGKDTREPREHVITHTFVYTTNDGKLENTYSWGNEYTDENPSNWYKNRPEDVSAAKAAIEQRRLYESAPWYRRIILPDNFEAPSGDETLDKYIEQAYQTRIAGLGFSNHQWKLLNNCKHEAARLVRDAQKLRDGEVPSAPKTMRLPADDDLARTLEYIIGIPIFRRN